MSTRHRCLYIATGDDARDDTTAAGQDDRGPGSHCADVSPAPDLREYVYEDRQIGFTGRP